jgi:hypothetical protein
VSTPKAPGGLMQQIEQERNSLYYKLFLDYRYGLEGPQPIYSQGQIDEARKSPEWSREYELQYLGVVGNVFSTLALQRCQEIQYDPNQIIPYAETSMGVDPAFGDSRFAIVVTLFVEGKIRVVIAEEHERPEFAAMINRIWDIKQNLGDISTIYCDASYPVLWQQLKRDWGEIHADKFVFDKLAEYRKNNWDPANHMRIIPTVFGNNQGAAMLQHAKDLVESPDNLVAIHPSFDKLLISLRTATAESYKLKKEDVSYNDTLDAFMLSLQRFKWSQ